MRFLLVVMLPALAVAEPRDFTATFERATKPMRYGRLMKTDHGPALVLTEQPHDCDEPVLIPGAYLVVAPLTDALQGKSQVWFEEPARCFPIRGTTVLELANGHAWGRIDAPVSNGVGGSGSFDAVVCPKPVRL
jgi:hypothetical protein